MNKLKIASFNIFSTRRYPDSDKLDMNFSADVIKKYTPDIKGYDEKELLSWPSDKAERKIDYIFVSKDFKVEKTYTADEIGSDHKMILTEIELG